MATIGMLSHNAMMCATRWAGRRLCAHARLAESKRLFRKLFTMPALLDDPGDAAAAMIEPRSRWWRGLSSQELVKTVHEMRDLNHRNQARSDWMGDHAAEFQLAPLEQETEDFKPGTLRRARH